MLQIYLAALLAFLPIVDTQAAQNNPRATYHKRETFSKCMGKISKLKGEAWHRAVAHCNQQAKEFDK